MKKFVKIIILTMLILSALTMAACNPDGSAASEKLIIYNWADYIDSDLLDEFAEYYKNTTGVTLEIVYSTFDTNESMITEIIKGDSSIDLICPSEYAIQKLMTSGYLLNLSALFEQYGLVSPNLTTINPDILDKVDGEFNDIVIDGEVSLMSDYFVPYMWGTLGILYNTAYVSEEEVEEYGWGILWNESGNQDLYKKILVKDSIRDTYAAAVMYLKEYDMLPEKYDSYSVQDLINCTEKEMQDAVENALKAQREVIKGYEVDFGKDDMIAEVAYVDLAWSGDALWAIEEAYYEDIELAYYVPEVGGNIWFDGWCVPTTAKNTKAATMFIDYMSQPENAIYNAMEIGYTTAIDVELMKANEDVWRVLIENEYIEVDEEHLALLDDQAFMEGKTIVSALRELGYSDEDIFYYYDDEGRYPDASLETWGLMRDFGSANAEVVAMWERVKAHGIFSWKLVLFLLAIIGGVAASYGLMVLIRSHRDKLRLRTPESVQSELKAQL